MRKQPEKRLPKKAIQVWRIQNTFDTLLFALIPIGYYFGQAYIFESFYEWITFALVGIVALYGIVRVGIWPTIQWHRFRYEVFDDEIDIQQGVIIVRRTLVPMVRVQHVDTDQGPILRRYKMAAVSITTAATTHKIPTLFIEDADSLRDQIAALASVQEDE
ncbi:YdbS protein [Bacillus sp. JCM 19046]|uniref:Membrane protein YdbS with pleckstrin-like domain n=1 Tax=Shouchella xiaoxiensis TaxID=766895 RepID=A0ABS2SXG1_9BACI|nr:PH domain-containing protein [Shouchella xiaoxiensis]MBM7840218.1 membrane protein YdbS with pleckstrin-like domain [Shouchella xiaoxiensis]GAF14416.1 YdbS protein [Bacillus sp. JCM 19045]GAF19130.1 YdbS protein [Bacillus sp. JCM 19046]